MKIIDKGKTMLNNNLKAKTGMPIILLITALLFAMSCKECPTEPDYDIYLTAEDVFSTSVVLNVALPDSGDVNTFALNRDDSTVATYTCSDDDTLIIDENLTPDTDYIYRVRFLKDGKTKSESDPVLVHT
ncbi:MAG: fibronectin type III domain-containing protein, partial [Candidatus Marinimicrobia bacterium]|nr:fibronectin type III domain-containing protein [Candidatus Neomarinimicrobiota bacterium]